MTVLSRLPLVLSAVAIVNHPAVAAAQLGTPEVRSCREACLEAAQRSERVARAVECARCWEELAESHPDKRARVNARMQAWLAYGQAEDSAAADAPAWAVAAREGRVRNDVWRRPSVLVQVSPAPAPAGAKLWLRDTTSLRQALVPGEWNVLERSAAVPGEYRVELEVGGSLPTFVPVRIPDPHQGSQVVVSMVVPAAVPAVVPPRESEQSEPPRVPRPLSSAAFPWPEVAVSSTLFVAAGTSAYVWAHAVADEREATGRYEALDGFENAAAIRGARASADDARDRADVWRVLTPVSAALFVLSVAWTIECAVGGRLLCITSADASRAGLVTTPSGVAARF